ncbi:MAG: S1 RNA-binding domain-containing protein [Victivallales bacterium]|nr:S1 RNA-binding domain-containing protein [Victivallales bacterium]
MESNESLSFAELFEQKSQVNMKIKTGDKVSGTVIQITGNSIFVDLGGRQDGVLDIKDCTAPDGTVTVKPGDAITAFVAGSDADGIQLRTHIGGRAAAVQRDSAVAEAFAAKIPIEGKITGERKGGFTVKVASVEAFCPYSQIDLRNVRKEGAEYIGMTGQFLITEYSEDGGNCVLSRRLVLEQESVAMRNRLLAGLQEGDILTGTVTSIMQYGAFVDLGGVEGMVHVSELSWDRGVRAEDVVRKGQSVSVKVIGYTPAEDGRNPRISLSLKQVTGDPWETLADSPEYAAGTRRSGTVSRLADFGAFILLAPGIEGLAHISQLGADHRVAHPSEVLKEGDKVDVTILGLDSARRRISLCIGEPKVKDEKPAELTAVQEKEVAQAAIAGQTMEGEVESQRPFGLFVKLPNGQTGLLHISQLNLPGSDNTTRERQMFRQYPLHSKISVVVREINGDRISLTTPEVLESESENTLNLNIQDQGGSSFGSLGDLFGCVKF